MDRRRFLLTSLAGVLASPLSAEAQPAGRLPLIGILATAPSAYSQVFRQALSERGYVEHRTVEIDARYSEGRPERFPELAAALINRRVDLLMAVSEPATRAARQATTTIPILMLVGDNPVDAGLVSSLTRPGANVTGFSSFQPDLVAKRLQLLKEVVPRLSQVGVLGHAADPMVARSFKEAEKASASLKLTVRAYQVSEPTELDVAFMRMAADRPQGVVILQNFWMFRHRENVTALAARTGLPTIYGLRDYVLTGGLMSYAPDSREPFVRAAVYVDKILKGVRPSDLPIERPTKFELVINLKTAKALGLTIPPSLLAGADQVIE